MLSFYWSFDEIEYLRIESEIVNLQAVSIQRIIKIETITKWSTACINSTFHSIISLNWRARKVSTQYRGITFSMFYLHYSQITSSSSTLDKHLDEWDK